MATKMIPASELREGYTVVLADGSSQVVIAVPVNIVEVTFDNGNVTTYKQGEMVTVEVEQGEF
jgi:hypothetical protein